jgi:hypothetical protein
VAIIVLGATVVIRHIDITDGRRALVDPLTVHRG